MFAENNDAVFMEDNDVGRNILHIKFANDEFPVDIKYFSTYPDTKYLIRVPSKKLTQQYDHFIRRCNGQFELEPPKTLAEALNFIIQAKKDEDNNIRTMQTDPNEIKKRLNKLYDDKKAEIMRQVSSESVLKFNQELAFKQMKDDLIEVAIHPEKYKFTITAENDNPFVWIVNFNEFRPGTLIAKGIERMEELTLGVGVEMKITFSALVYPVMPPVYDFVRLKMFSNK